MKKVVIDGVECEVIIEPCASVLDRDVLVMHYRPLVKPKKTIVQVAADYMGWSEEFYRKENKAFSLLLDTLEQRLAKLEEK